MYIGNDLQIAHPSYKIIDDISSGFNGSTTSFALNVSGATPVPFPISTQQVMISVNGVVQEPDPTGSAGFKLLGSNIVFSSAPANGHAFFGVINAGADYVTAGSEFPDGSATAPSFTFQDDQDTGWFRSGSGAVGYSANGAQTLTFDGNGLTVTGDASFVGDSSKNLLWDKSDGQLEFADNAKAIFGTGSDLEVYHDGNQSVIKDTSGKLQIFSEDIEIYDADAGFYIDMVADGAVNLYWDGELKLSTSQIGVDIQDASATSVWTKLSNSSGIAGYVYGNGATEIGFLDGQMHWTVKSTKDGSVDLYHDNTKRFETTSSGINVIGNIGVGDTSADYELDILGATPQIRLEETASGGSKRLDIWVDASNAYIGANQSAQTLLFQTGGTTGLTINSSQNATFAGDLLVAANKRVLIGTTTEGYARADNLTVYEDGDCGITIRSSTTGYGNINFSRGTSGSDEYKGDIEYHHNTDTLSFRSNATVALTLNSSQNATFAGTVTATSFSGSGANLTNLPASGGVITATASGSISAHDAVVVNTDGTVSTVAISSETTGSRGTFNTGDTTYADSCWDPDNDKLYVVYTTSSGGHGEIRIGTVSGTSISWNTAQDFDSNNGVDDPHCVMMESGKVGICWERNGTIYTRIAVYGSNTFTFGNIKSWASGSIPGYMDYDPSSKVAGFGYLASNSRAKALYFKNNGANNCTGHDGRTVDDYTGSAYFTTTFHKDSGWWIHFYARSGTRTVCHLLSDTDVATQGSPFLWAAQQYEHLQSKYDVDSKNAILQARGSNTTSYRLNAYSFTVDTTNSRTGAIVGYLESLTTFNATYHGFGYNPITKKYMYVARNAGSTGTWREYTYSGGTFTLLGSETQMESNQIYAVSIANSDDGTSNIWVYKASGNNSYGSYKVHKPALTNAVSQTFIGFSSAGYSNGATATINVVGNTTTKSSLTPGKKYYLQGNGSVATTADTIVTIEAGTALSSTSLLIQPHN